MKHILTIIATLSLTLGLSFAACGKTVTDKGKLKSFDKETKTLVVEVDGKEVKRTLTPASKGGDTAESLVGKAVVVVSEHNKVDSVTAG
jgi:uncharacterized lipoprotein YehR (DUF1307 family)